MCWVPLCELLHLSSPALAALPTAPARLSPALASESPAALAAAADSPALAALSTCLTAVHVLQPLVALVLAPLTVVIVRVTPVRQRKERLLAPNITHERSI